MDRLLNTNSNIESVRELTTRLDRAAAYVMVRTPLPSHALWTEKPTCFAYELVGPVEPGVSGQVGPWDVMALLEEHPSWVGVYVV